jgi:hypothetical protein
MKTNLTLFVAVLAVSLFGMGCASTPAFVSDGLVAYYPFNGNAKDESGNGNDLVNNGVALTKGIKGTENSAFKFDGDSFMQASDSETLQLVDFTVSMWIKPEPWTNNTALLMKDEHAGGQNYGLWLNNPTGNSVNNPVVQFYSNSPKAGGGYIGDGVHQEKPVSTETFTMVIGTFSENKLNLYVNGIKAVTKETSIKPEPSKRPLFIGYDGGFQGGRYNKFKGVMDNVRIYNRALSAEEVKALYDLEKPKGK